MQAMQLWGFFILHSSFYLNAVLQKKKAKTACTADNGKCVFNCKKRVRKSPYRSCRAADVQTVKNHLAALQGSDEEAVYRSISKKLTALAKCRNPQRDYTALERIMDEKYSTDL